ncbi:MAG: helix-turn-helix transcriptional regulator [Candidatus Heimdallarchaeaceae archaeon]
MKSRKKLTIVVFILILFSHSNLGFRTDATDSNTMMISLFSDQDSIIISEHIVQITMISFQEIIVKETINFVNNQSSPLSSLELWNNHSDSRDFYVEDEQGEIYHEKIENLITVYFRINISSGQPGVIFLNYVLENHFYKVVSESSDYYRFEFASTISYNTLEYRVDVRYVSRFHLFESQDVFPFYPSTNPPIWSGGYYNIDWKFNNAEPFSIDYLIYLCFEPPKTHMNVWGYVFGSLGFLGLGSFVTLWVMRRKQKEMMRKLDDIYLTNDQKFLIKLIAEKGGRITQKELVDSTEFSKSKVSRNLNPLEQGGFIRKEKWGNQYRVYLTELGKKVAE